MKIQIIYSILLLLNLPAISQSKKYYYKGKESNTLTTSKGSICSAYFGDTTCNKQKIQSARKQFCSDISLP